MARAAIVPATPAYDASGTPFSPEYGDIYHSAESGPGQARHVFLGGNDLPGRWAGARVFTILETGFGLGLNFLATWQAARDDPARPGRLHVVSIEKHPFTRDGLAALHARYPEFAPLSAELRASWPLPLPGLHRLEFDGGRVTLTLALGDVAEVLPRLRLGADAIYLDGFAPDRNPAMWTPAAMKAIARLARPGATLATYTTARAVRDALAAAGFSVAPRAGFGRKREMLAGHYAPVRPPRAAPPPPPRWKARRAIVVGAGLAGAAVAERLAARGWEIDLVERRGGPAMEASALPAGVFHPHVSRDDSVLSRLTRAGIECGMARWQALERDGHALAGSRCGVLQMAKDARDEARMAGAVRALGFPPQYLEYLPRDAVAEQTGHATPRGGWWFPESGWMQPASLIRAQLAVAARGSRIAGRFGAPVEALSADGELWRALAADGAEIAAAPVVVLANSHDAVRLAPLDAPLRRVRGQLTCLPAGRVAGLRAVLAGAGHLVPLADGSTVAGATYDFEDDDPEPSAAGHAANLERVAQLLSEAVPDIDAGTLTGSVGFRCVAADRLPLVGALPRGGAAAAGSALRDLPRAAGLYGAFGYASRGLAWAALGGELIACQIEGEPLPVEGDLADAVDPARFALRRARRETP